MKLLLLFVCAVLVHVNAQCCSCGCPSPPCRPPPPPCRPPCPKPCPKPCTCPAPVVVEPLPSFEIQSCPVGTSFISPFVSPVVSPIETSIYSSPVYSTAYSAPAVALPTCNCPTIPSLPVSPQILPGLQVPPFLSGLGCLSPCLGGFADFAVPLGMINPFLPAASPVSAIAPTVSSLYPPINPCNCGCKYLKTIPIPPPCI